MRLRVVGNSHVGALKRGLKRALADQPSRFEEIDVFPIVRAKLELQAFSRLRAGAVELTDTSASDHLADRIGVHRIDGDVWGVCMGLHNISLLRDAFWDHHAPTTVALDDEAPVSGGLVAEIVHAGQEHVQAFLLQLQEAGVPVLVISSPPLRRDHPAVATRRAEVMLEVDRLAREHLAEFADRHQLPFVGPPEQSLDENGFLREEFHSSIVRANDTPDLAHANQEYGRLMMRRVIQTAEDRCL